MAAFVKSWPRVESRGILVIFKSAFLVGSERNGGKKWEVGIELDIEVKDSEKNMDRGGSAR
jgi:hypothetical protein